MGTRCGLPCSLEALAILGPSLLQRVVTISATVEEKLITAQVRAIVELPFQIYRSSIMAVENRNTRRLRSPSVATHSISRNLMPRKDLGRSPLPVNSRDREAVRLR
jgi:hypothetical protein